MENLRSTPSFIYLCKIALAKIKTMMNEKGIDLELLYRFEAANREKWYDGIMPRYISEILLNINDQHMDEAEGWINKAIEAVDFGSKRRNHTSLVGNLTNTLDGEKQAV